MGEIIDHFEILGELGHGGMGVVYLARDTWLDRQVAIKVVRLDEARTELERKARETFTERLLREAKIAAALDHPGIVTIYQVGVLNSQPYIVMQFIDGPTLDSLLSAVDGALDRGDAGRILKELAGALDYAHDNGVIHRDIKPLNIMLARGRTVKICDFGIAKSAMLTRKASSFLMGTPHYMAPEQLTYDSVDRRADQWALGVVAYRMVTGMLPFQADDVSELARLIVRGPLPSPQECDASLAPRVTEVFEKVLTKAPGGRYQTCAEFATDLAAALDESAQTHDTTKIFLVAQPASGHRQTDEADIASAILGLGIDRGTAPQNDSEAVMRYREAADAGDASAMSNLGFMYANGRGGLPRDDAQAAIWYHKAAEAGESGAMFNLGIMCANGRGGLPKDDAEAVRWYRRAAEAGEGSGMFSLGVMYAHGRGGLSKDDAEAVRWYCRAADAGEARAMFNLGVMYARGRGGLPKDDAEAVRCYRRAADAGEARAMFNLGVMHANGRGGLAKDEAEAVLWYRKAAYAGYAIGMNELGIMYEEGRGGLPRDDNQAVIWYRKAADAGDAIGMVNLGMMYEKGLGGLPKDDAQATNWYRQAADSGDANALEVLKRMNA